MFQQRPLEEDRLFTSDGLKPTMADLDNLFEDSSDETDVVSQENFNPGRENWRAENNHFCHKFSSVTICVNNFLSLDYLIVYLLQ